MKNFIAHNRVLLAALVSALLLSLQQLVLQKVTDLKVIGFAVLIALLGAIANQWKGKGVTLTGIIGTLSGVAFDIYQSGTFTWNEFVLSAIVAILTAVSSSLQPEKHEPKTGTQSSYGKRFKRALGPSYNRN